MLLEEDHQEIIEDVLPPSAEKKELAEIFATEEQKEAEQLQAEEDEEHNSDEDRFAED